MPNQITKIIIHCSATPNGKWLGKCKDDPASIIDSWHKQRKFKRRPLNAEQFNPHLKHIGYHFVIGLDGKVYTGRAEGEQGAHVRGHNKNSIGICLIGTHKFTDEQWFILSKLIYDLKGRYPRATIKGHRDYSPDLDGDGTVEPHEFLKICPGFSVGAWIKNDYCALENHIQEEITYPRI